MDWVQSPDNTEPHAMPPIPPEDHEASESKKKSETELKAQGQEGDKVLTDREAQLKDAKKIPPDLHGVKRILEEKVGFGKSFDLMLREMVVGDKKVALFYANGLVKDTVLTEILKRLTYLEKLDSHSVKDMMDHFIPHIQVESVDRIDEAVDKVLAGSTAIFVDGETEAVMIDAKNFPVRSIEEPVLERVVRGSKDGFVETLLTNVSLVRRRLRDPRLKLEISQVGERTKTDVCLAFIQDIADPSLVESIRDKIQKIETDGLPLADKQLEEALIKKGWNPYPQVRYSERPDVIAAHLLEGHIVLFVDTSPSVMIMPSTFFHLVQHAEEYRQSPLAGTYFRWMRYFGIFASLFLIPLWYLLVAFPDLKPPGLEWIGPQKASHLPLWLQFVFVEIGIDLMRMAAIHTPTPLAAAMGLIAAILIGDIAVKSGLFVNEVILYMAVATIGMFATPSYELGVANRITRLVLLILTAIFAIPGFVVGVTLWFLMLATQRSFNSPYLWPLLPFNLKAILSVIVRKPFSKAVKRMSFTKPIDSTRQPQ